jgi:ABC-2 type transport system permease protein
MWVYTHTYTTGLQNALVYRWNFILRILGGFVPLMGAMFLWGAVYEGKGEVGGYTYAQMIGYFFGLIVLDALVAPTDDDFQIANEIKDGVINQVLLKPVNYAFHRLALYFANRTGYVVCSLLPVLLAGWLLRDRISLPTNPEALGWTLLAVLGSAALQFCIAFCGGLLAFWLTDISSIIFIVYGFEYMAGGHVFPLDLLPKPAFEAALWTPFPYEFWFPMAIWQGKLDPGMLARGLVMQWAWVLILACAARGLWLAGLRRYTAVGG